jgi:DNA repair exonuclease SbcCD ATPase subunit
VLTDIYPFIRRSDMVRPDPNSPLGRQLVELEQVEVDVSERQQRIAQLRDQYQEVHKQHRRNYYNVVTNEDGLERTAARMEELRDQQEAEAKALRPVLQQFHRLQAEFDSAYAEWRRATAAAATARSIGG